jgi:hypothetical protein
LAPNSFHAKRPTIDHDLVQALEWTKGGMRQRLVQLHQQPWTLPLGVYPKLLERVANNWNLLVLVVALEEGECESESSSHHHQHNNNNNNNALAVETIQQLLQGMLQVHSF